MQNESEEKKMLQEAPPKVSIIIPTFNCAQTIALTLESLLEQDYPNFEILVIDGGSKDRTLELVKTFVNEKIHLYTTKDHQRYALLNQGISFATGQYINCLFPGDYYISPFTLTWVMESAMENQRPHLAYCGTLLRDGKSQVKILNRELNDELLKNGHQPTSLQSCWFRRDVFNHIGNFDKRYQLRGGYELLCRFIKHQEFQIHSIHRMLIDHDLRSVTRSMILQHFWETLKGLIQHYGFLTTVKWLFHQRDGTRFFKLWWEKIQMAFFGMKSPPSH